MAAPRPVGPVTLIPGHPLIPDRAFYFNEEAGAETREVVQDTMYTIASEFELNATGLVHTVNSANYALNMAVPQIGIVTILAKLSPLNAFDADHAPYITLYTSSGDRIELFYNRFSGYRRWQAYHRGGYGDDTKVDGDTVFVDNTQWRVWQTAGMKVDFNIGKHVLLEGVNDGSVLTPTYDPAVALNLPFLRGYAAWEYLYWWDRMLSDQEVIDITADPYQVVQQGPAASKLNPLLLGQDF